MSMAAPAFNLRTDLDAMWLLPSLKPRIANQLAGLVNTSPAWMKNERPLVSFSFDDVAKSAAHSGARLLAEHGATGTFYVSGSLVGTQGDYWINADRDDIAELIRSGHEIGCHTHGHLSIANATPERIFAETRTNTRFLRTLEPNLKIDNFAYPFGRASLGLKKRLATRFHSSRGTRAEVNHGRIDLQLLSAFPLIDRKMTPRGIDRILDRAVQTNGWAIFYTNDVALQPSPYGCSPALLAYALTAAEARGIECAPIRDALAKIGAERTF